MSDKRRIDNKEMKQETISYLKALLNKEPQSSLGNDEIKKLISAIEEQPDIVYKEDVRTDLEIIVDNYIRCMKYLLKGKVASVTRFKDGVTEWLITDIGLVELDAIPHDESELTECRYEIEALIADNDFDNDTVLQALNDRIRSLSAE